MSKVETAYKLFLGFLYIGFLALLGWLLILLAGIIV